MKSFGEIIKTERENKGLILRKVASALDIDQAIVSKFQRGDRIPSKVH
jgi:transcriptional regulator with XRE-family HTH domain